MIENFQAICIDTVYACAAFVGTAVAIYGLTRGVKILSGGVKCLAAASLAGSLIIGGMVVTNVRIAGAKTNDTQQVGGDLSRTNDVGQVGGDAGMNGVEQVGDDEGTNGVPRVGGLALGALNLDGPQEPSAEPTLDIVSVDVDVEEGVVRIDAELSNYGSTVAFSDVRVVTTDNLTDGTWTPIAQMEVGVMGNAISVVVPAAGVIRFYRLQVGDGIGLAALGMFNVGVGADAPVAEPLDPDGDEDGDGVSNGDEEIEGTNPLAPDTDGDGLTDGEELRVTRTNPRNSDTDGDGIPDGDECAVGSDPNVYSPVSSSAPVYEMVGTYSVDVQYQTPTTDGFSIYGISWPGGAGTAAELAYDVNGRYWSNASRWWPVEPPSRRSGTAAMRSRSPPTIPPAFRSAAESVWPRRSRMRRPEPWRAASSRGVRAIPSSLPRPVLGGLQSLNC
ncbi:MAG: thrombospondin type 3 repeat-containing protein [Kiritimatiellae bacterium]|nr:thrombospondin type 3 repeat-containing protein [Kiritimatiellia bacterium]